MEHEVKIKVGMDTSEVEPKMRSLHFDLKALQEDTELLKDLQLEYKDALAESGGKRTPKVLAAYKKVLELQADVARDERNIDRRTKNLKLLQKPLNSIAKFFGAKGLSAITKLGVIGGAAYGASKYLEGASNLARETRSSYLSSISTGLGYGEYSSLTSGSYIGGAEKQNITKVLSNINQGLLALKLGIGDVGKLAEISTLTGISITNMDGKLKTSSEFLKDIQEWVKDKPEDVALQYLSGIGVTPDLIDAMKKGAISQQNQYKISQEQKEKYDAVEKERRRSEEEYDRLRRNALSSMPAKIWYSMKSGLYGFLNTLLEGQKKDTRTEEEKKRDLATRKIKELSEKEQNYREKANSRWRGKSQQKMYLEKAEKTRAEIDRYQKVIAGGNLDELEIYGTPFEPEQGVRFKKEDAPLQQLSTSNKFVEGGRTYIYDKKGRKAEVLSLRDTVPEKVASSTGSTSKMFVVNNRVYNENNFNGNFDPYKTEEAVSNGISEGITIGTSQRLMNGVW